jgi:hypothetical protein
MPLTLGGDRIQRARAPGAPRDALALRFAVERAFRTVALQPAGARRSIVCVRRLRLPVPPSTSEWAGRLDREMRQVLSRAVRPFDGAVPAAATVVEFADEAELLACLARDWCRGDGDAWWWRDLFGRAASGELVRREYAAAITAVPDAMARLESVRAAVDVVRAMPPEDCEQLAASMAAAFAVPEWTDSLPAPLHVLSSPRLVDGTFAAERVRRLGAVWPDDRVAAAASLPLPKRAFLGLALTVHRDPRLARTPGVASSIRHGRWPPRIADRAVPFTAPATPDVQPVVVRTTEADVRADASPESERRPHVDAVDGTSAEVARAVAPASARHRSGRDGRDAWPDAAEVAPPMSADLGRDAVRPMASPLTGVATPAAIAGVDTEFAGIVYLVNLALHLELYGDFTQPARPGLDLPLGDFLALLGPRVCGPAFDRDPIGLLLAEIAGRGVDEPPGREFAPPGERSLGDWVGECAALMAASAAAALRVDEGSALLYLVARPGRIVLSPARLDVFFVLDHHPLAIRIAGLDRDPGWVPAAGRTIELHYE